MFVILISYRARGNQEFRRRQLMTAIDNFKTYFKQNKIEYKIVISEQNNDNKFNRGFLLNAAFLEAEKEIKTITAKKYVHMNADYTFDLSRPFPQELLDFKEGIIDLYRITLPVLGGACVFDAKTYKTFNGFPNDLEGWGSDDWAIYNRIVHNNIHIMTPDGLFNSGFIMEERARFDDDYYITNEKNMVLASRCDFETNGLTTIKYKVDGYGEFNDDNVIIHYLINNE